MDEKLLKKLSKKELINKVIEQQEILEKQKMTIEEMEKEIQDRHIKLDKAGTIAEATVLLNGVIEATEKAAAQYLENIEKLSGDQERVMKQQQAEHEKKMQELYNETKEKCDALQMKTERECAEKIADAERQVEDRWSTLELKWDTFCTARDDMKEMLKLLKNDSLSKEDLEK